MADKIPPVVKKADELAMAIAYRALGQKNPKLLPVADGQDTMGMDTMFGALDRLTRWIAVRNRIEDDEPTESFFDGAMAKLSRKGGGRGGRGSAATEADGAGGEPAAAGGTAAGGTDASGPAASVGDPGVPAGGAFSDALGAHLSNGIASPET